MLGREQEVRWHKLFSTAATPKQQREGSSCNHGTKFNSYTLILYLFNDFDYDYC